MKHLKTQRAMVALHGGKELKLLIVLFNSKFIFTIRRKLLILGDSRLESICNVDTTLWSDPGPTLYACI